ncbi:hypothetical protein KDK88_10415 [bacterium]|nr:hypothetical protein [bacterium]
MKRLTVLLLLLLAASTAVAGANPFGVRGGIASSPDQLVLGAHMQVYDLSPEAKIVPNVELGFGDDWTIYSVNAALLYTFLSSDMSGFKPYVGGELGINKLSYDLEFEGFSASVDETKLVINGVAGVKKMLNDRQELRLEFKLGLSDWANDFKVLAGLTFF